MIPSSASASFRLLLLLHFLCFSSASSSPHNVELLVHNLPLLGFMSHQMHLSPLPHPQDAEAEEALIAAASSFDNEMEWTRSSVDEMGQLSGLTMRLMHRDSPWSPLRKLRTGEKTETAEEVWEERLNRDKERVKQIKERVRRAVEKKEEAAAIQAASYEERKAAMAAAGFTGPLMSGLKQGSGEYFTRVGVGTPAKQALMVVDTGSDIMWLQCAPCADCYTQSGPIFDPTSSRSFRKLPCASPICGLLELHGCQARTNLCLYQVEYGDGSFTEGEFAMESLSFHGAIIRNVALGCGHDNEGLFAGAAGLFGLGGGSLSFISQFGRQYRKVFSYCLMDRDKTGMSTLTFGTLPKEVTRYTPLLRNPNLETFYYVGLSGISVGGELLATIPAAAFRMDAASGEGGVIIDSGTSVSRLVEVAYGPLRSAFRASTRSLPFIGGFSLFDTCYDLSGRTSVTLPTLSLHFQGGATMDLPPANYFVPVNAKGTYCLAFASTSGQLSIIGNIQQQGFRVVFDAAASRLGFAAGQC